MLTIKRMSYRKIKQLVIDEWERAFLGELMTEVSGNVSQAARLAAMDRNHLRDLLKKHQIDPRDFRAVDLNVDAVLDKVI